MIPPNITVRALVINLFLFIQVYFLQPINAKVVDVGLQLPELIELHPDKGWLIKFYAPWCHHCKQLELTYSNVAERIHQQHNNLIVGRVDCTKYSQICHQFHVDSYPTINFLKAGLSVAYRGDRSIESIIGFAERMNSPNIGSVENCDHLKALAHKHGLIVLSTESDTAETTVQVAFKSLARAMKSTHWFYRYSHPCQNYTSAEKLYLLKKHLNKPIPIIEDASDTEALVSAITRQIIRESQPIFGTLSSTNIDRLLSLNKTLLVAVLDEYKPAKKFSPVSSQLYGIVERTAIEYSQNNQDIVFVWTSDIELMRSIVIGKITIPNLVFINPDLTFHVHLTQDDSSKQIEPTNTILPKYLEKDNIVKLIRSYSSGNIKFEGDGVLSPSLRALYGYYIRIISMYQANPLLCGVLIGFPSLVVIFVIYTTCCMDSSNYTNETEYQALDSDEEFGDGYDKDATIDQRRNMNEHSKQE